MQLKRVIRSSVKEALAAVRAELGPEALVLSTRLVPASGLRGLVGQRDVEVTAAADASLTSGRTTEVRKGPERSGEVRGGSGRSEQVRTGPKRSALPDLSEPVRTFSDLSGPSRTSPDLSGPLSEPLIARLIAAGLDRALATEVAEALPRKRRRTASLDALRAALSDRLGPVAAGGESFSEIEVFVGPPGAGKTTTIAKIAAQTRARRGTRLSLLAADGFRVGAVEQLRLYAEIIGAPFSVARSAADVDNAVADLRRPMLVDTAGRSPSDPTMADLYSVLSGRRGVRTHLVIPATASRREAERIMDRYAAAKPSRVVLTRVDEADSWASLIPLVRERGLAMSYLGTGQTVPDDLTIVTPAVMAQAVLGEEAVAA